MIVGVLLAAALPIAVIYLLVSHIRLKARVSEMERRLQTMAGNDQIPSTTRLASEQGPIDEAKPVPSTEYSDLVLDNPWERSALTPEDTESTQREPAVGGFADEPPRFFVFRNDVAIRVSTWILENWFLAIAALSLALAGVFLVQYGVENGLLTPFWRVASAAALGCALIVVAEILRRRSGDEAETHTAYLPSTFAGAGLVALYAAAISARQLYGLIGAETAFGTMAVISVLAVVLGWFYGPFLAITGILGATAAPFAVGGTSDTPQLFFYYFAMIALVGLLIDAVRRWAWTTVVTLLICHAAAWVTFAADAGDVHYLSFALITAFAAAIIPPLQWKPTHGGAMVLQSFMKGKASIRWPEFPTRVAAGAYIGAVAVGLLVAIKAEAPLEVWAAIYAIVVLFLVAAIWYRKAPALTDLGLFASAALLAIVLHQGETSGALVTAFESVLPPGSPWPKHVTILSTIALVVSLVAFWRASIEDRWQMQWAAGASVFAPLVLVALEFRWQPAGQLSAGLWAAHPMIVAAVMTLFAERCIHTNATDKRHAAIFTLSALTMISFALILMLSDVALTVALAIMALVAACLDRRLKMPQLAFFVAVGAITTSWRLILDPGLLWAESAPLWELWFGYGAVIVLQAAAWIVLRPLHRISTKVTLESAIWMLGAVFVCVLIYRALGAQAETHWGLGLIALVGLITMAGQLYRLRSAPSLRLVRIVLASLYAIWGFGGMLLVATLLNPLLNSSEIVLGAPVFDTLLVAFGLSALALGLFAWKLNHIADPLRLAFSGLAVGLSATYVALEIRRFWRGDILAVPGTTEPELYSYTVAMLLTSVALLFTAFARRSVHLRRMAVIGVALTIAKVFLVDMAGLAGLVRVASFLGLGLALAGLAWINRLMSEQWDQGDQRAKEIAPKGT